MVVFQDIHDEDTPLWYLELPLGTFNKRVSAVYSNRKSESEKQYIALLFTSANLIDIQTKIEVIPQFSMGRCELKRRQLLPLLIMICPCQKVLENKALLAFLCITFNSNERMSLDSSKVFFFYRKVMGSSHGNNFFAKNKGSLYKINDLPSIFTKRGQQR